MEDGEEMTPSDDENGIGLDHNELRILAGILLSNHIANSAEDWLLWEDVPGLGEYTFDQLYDEMLDLGREIRAQAGQLERRYDIDGQHLLEQAS
jgi:hypothetical protein